MRPASNFFCGRLLLFLLCASAALAASNAEKSFAQPGVLVLPVETDLQRELVPNEAEVYVLLDADSFVPADFAKLKKTLSPHKISDKRVHLSIYSADAHLEAHSLVRYGLLGFMYDSGFEHFSANIHFSNAGTTWNALTERLALGDDAATEPELAMVKEDVKAYPVLNPLSRLLTSGADCVLILPKVDLENGAIPKTVVNASKAAVDGVQLREKRCIAFVLPHITGDDKSLAIERLFELGEFLGFGSSTLTFR